MGKFIVALFILNFSIFQVRSDSISNTQINLVNSNHWRNRTTFQDRFRYLGCFDTWENFVVPPKFLTNQDFTFVSCAEFCFNNDEKLVVSLLKGIYCFCFEQQITEILMRVEDYKCSVKCPIKANDLEPSYFPDESCGGNDAFSAYFYCSAENFQCPSHQLFHISTKPIQIPNNEFPIRSQLFSYLSCTTCKSDSITECAGRSLHPKFDYFPRNSPHDCIDFCKRNVQYISNGQTLTRKRTPYAALGWKFGGNGVYLPICSCYEKDELQLFEQIPVDNSYCQNLQFLCPNRYAQNLKCGGEPPFYWSIYCTEDNCQDLITTISPTVSIPTTEKSPTTETLKTTTFNTPIIITKTTTTMRTTSPTLPISSSSEDDDDCPCKCTGLDEYKNLWEGCHGEIVKKLCPMRAGGYAKWFCGITGYFSGPNPDYTNCSSGWIGIIENELEEAIINGTLDEETVGKILNLVLIQTENPTSDPNQSEGYFGHEIAQLIEIVKKSVQGISVDVALENLIGFAETSTTIVENILISQGEWMQLPKENRKTIVTDLITTIELTVFELTKKIDDDYLDSHEGKFEQAFTTKEKDFKISGGVFIQNGSDFERLRFPSEGETFIELPPNWIEKSPMTRRNRKFNSGEFVGIQIPSKLVRDLFPEFKNLVFNGMLLSLSLSEPTFKIKPSFSDDPIRIKFQHDVVASGKTKTIPRKLHKGEKRKAVFGSSSCLYWNVDNLSWSNDGCKTYRSGTRSTICHCDHLTSFTILMDFHQYTGRNKGLEILTLIISPISILCLFATIVLLWKFGEWKNPRNRITKHLSFSLLIGHLLLITLVDRNYFLVGDGTCATFGAITHYVFLCAFLWMAFEGIYVYKMIIRVFDNGVNPLRIYKIIAYAAPILIIGATAAIGYPNKENPYGGETFCWLEDYYLWAFTGPIALIILGNIFILTIALWIAYRMKCKAPSGESKLIILRNWAKAAFSLNVILGTTWSFGYLIFLDPNSLVFAYIFTILNASQGIFLLIFQCLLNEKVRSGIERRFDLPQWLQRKMSSPLNSFNEESFTAPKKSKVKGIKREKIILPIQTIDAIEKIGSRSRKKVSSIKSNDTSSTTLTANNSFSSLGSDLGDGVRTSLDFSENVSSNPSYNPSPRRSLDTEGSDIGATSDSGSTTRSEQSLISSLIKRNYY